MQHHTNICFLVSVCWDEGMIGLLMELSDVGPLSDVMATKSEGFTWKEPMHKYLTDVGYGLQVSAERAKANTVLSF